MLQEVLVSPTAKLDISKLLKSSPSPSPPPRSISSRPSLSRSFSLSVTESNPRFGASPTTSTAPPLPASTFLPQPFNVPRQPSIGSQASLLIPATSSKRTASTSPQDSRQERKKPSRQWSKADSEELLKLRTGGKKWDDIAARFSGRSNTACRLRYQNYLERRYPWTEEEKKALAQLYERGKETMWSAIAAELKIPPRAVEDMHWDIGREEMAVLAGGKTLHPSRASGDLVPGGSPIQSAFPPGGQAMTPTSFMNTPASTFSGPPPTPRRRLAQPQLPATTDSAPTPGMMAGGEVAGFAAHRWNAPELPPGSSRGQLLPSMAELERSVQAYAPPSRGRHQDEDEDDEDDEDEDDEGSDEQWEKVERK